MSEEQKYELALAFPDQSPNFAHGFMCGKIWQQMNDYPANDIVETVVSDIRPTIEAMAMAKGWVEEIKKVADGWLEVRLRSPLPREQP